MQQPLRPVSLFLIPPTLVLVGVCLFIALLNRQWELTVLGLLVLAVAAAAKLWAAVSLSGMTCRAGIDRCRAFPGEQLTLRVEAENRCCLPVSLEVLVPVGGLRAGSATPWAATGLLWFQQAAFRWDLTATARGVHRVGPVFLSAGDLLGFFWSGRRAKDSVEVLVYPRILPLRPFPLPRRDFFGIAGAESPVRDPVYILGTRDYQHGRPARHIHWKASARHHRLQEKLFEPTEQEKILLLLDVEGFAHREAGEEFERTLEGMASLAVWLDRRGCAVGLAANGTLAGVGAPIVPVGRGAQQLRAILEALARLTLRPAGALRDVVDGLQLSWGTSCVAFALEANPGVLRTRDLLAGRRMPVILFLADGVVNGGRESEVRPLREMFVDGAAG